MDHKAFWKSLPKEQRDLLREKSNAAGLLHLAGHAGAMVITGPW